MTPLFVDARAAISGKQKHRGTKKIAGFTEKSHLKNTLCNLRYFKKERRYERN